ncbi:MULTISPECIES: TetR family transcriptional regulator [unclassified Tepidimonas]|uniref:TetR family transcriptional regulator n=1 Tax=unclassified Tepidimonas TaxID=2631705 RepID=UPI003C7E5829
MARRTKEEAEQTRAQILAAARRVFHERGVGQTSLEHIAQAAGVTRGAIYWHFANKGELLQAMCDEVAIPFIDRLDYTLLQDTRADALSRVRNFLLQVTGSIDADPQLRAIMQVLEFKCEFVGERARDLDDWVRHNEECFAKLERTYAAARREGRLRPDLTPSLAALETQCFLAGLIRLRLLGQPAMQAPATIPALIEAHVRSRACPPAEAQAPRQTLAA